MAGVWRGILGIIQMEHIYDQPQCRRELRFLMEVMLFDYRLPHCRSFRDYI